MSLANIYASYNGDEDIFNTMNLDRIEEYQQVTSMQLELSQAAKDGSECSTHL